MLLLCSDPIQDGCVKLCLCNLCPKWRVSPWWRGGGRQLPAHPDCSFSCWPGWTLLEYTPHHQTHTHTHVRNAEREVVVYILLFFALGIVVIVITQRLLMFYLSVFVFCLWIVRARFFFFSPHLFLEKKKKKKRGISIAGLFSMADTPPPPSSRFDPGNKNQLFFVMWIVAWSSSSLFTPPTPSPPH